MPGKTALLILILLAATVMAQQATDKPTIKMVPADNISPASGQEMYQSYCASCHGAGGNGNGPAAKALKSAPANLTMLAKSNGGAFPAGRFRAVLSGKATIAAHGSPEMPLWGNIFRRMSHSHDGEVQQRVFNLSNYVQSLQQL